MSSERAFKQHPSPLLESSQELAHSVDDILRRGAHTDLVSEWSLPEDSKLMSLVSKFGEFNWLRISQSMGPRSSSECQNRWNFHLKQTVKKGGWTQEEDALLKKWISENGPNDWTRCSELITGRNGKQCRERWVNILDPRVMTGDWSTEDQVRIFQLMKQYKTSWSKISSSLSGRTENSIKNYFYSTMRRIDSSSVRTYLQEAFLGTGTISVTSSSEEEFMEIHQMSNLNELGRRICLYLRAQFDCPSKECPELYDFLRCMIISKEVLDKPQTKSKRKVPSDGRKKEKTRTSEADTSCGGRFSSEETCSKVYKKTVRPKCAEIISGKGREAQTHTMLKKRAPSFCHGPDFLLMVPVPIRRKLSGMPKGTDTVRSGLSEIDEEEVVSSPILQKGAAFKPIHQICFTHSLNN